MAVTAGSDPEDEPVVGHVLQRRHLLRHPDDGTERQDDDAEAEPDPRGGPGRGGERDHALDEGRARAGDQLVDHPCGLQAQVLGMSGRCGHVARLVLGPAHAGQEDTDVRGSRRRHAPSVPTPVGPDTSETASPAHGSAPVAVRGA